MINKTITFATSTHKNQTDGFMATVLEPCQSGLPVYFVFNCYGMDRQAYIPPKHKNIIVEIAKDNGKDSPCKRFDWNELIPVEVSEFPKILLRGNQLKYALSFFNQQVWNDVYSFITINRYAIQKHWTEPDSMGLFSTLKKLNGEKVIQVKDTDLL
jgi:hypothetical protein